MLVEKMEGRSVLPQCPHSDLPVMEREGKRQRWLNRRHGSSKGIRKYVIVHGKIVKDKVSESGAESCAGKHCSAEKSYLKQLTLQGFIGKAKENHKRGSTVPESRTLSATSRVAAPRGSVPAAPRGSGVPAAPRGSVPAAPSGSGVPAAPRGSVPAAPSGSGVLASVVTRGVRKKASSAVVNFVGTLHETGHEGKENVCEPDVPSDNSEPIRNWQGSRSGLDSPFDVPVPAPIPVWQNVQESEGDWYSRTSYKSPPNSCPRTTATLTNTRSRRRKGNQTAHRGSSKHPRTEITACREVDEKESHNSRKDRTLRERNPNILRSAAKDPCSDSKARHVSRGVSYGKHVTENSRTHSDSEAGKGRVSSGKDQTAKCLEPEKPDSEGCMYENTDELLADLSYCEKIRI